MLLKAFNRSLVEDRENTFLTASASAGGTTLTVIAVDSNAWANNDFIIVGEIGQKNAEVMQVNGAVSDGTSLTIDNNGSGGLRFNHSPGEPVYRIDFNQVEFSRSTTDDSGSASVLTTIEIQPDDEFTRFEDTTNTTGFGFVRFKNGDSSALSSYSDGVNYEVTGEGSSRDPRTLWMIRKKVRKLLGEPTAEKLTDEDIDDAINDKQRDIGHQRLWSFYEVVRSFSSVANQFAYTIPTTVQKIHSVNYDTQPLGWLNKTKWDMLHWDTDETSDDPWGFNIWNRELRIYPRPASAANTTTISANVSATDTSMSVASSSGFKRGDFYRLIIDSEVIYATASTSTTFTGLLRGREGTTAAAHTSGATVTERNIVYNGHEEPSDLIDTQDRTKIPEPDVVAYGSAIDLAPYVNKDNLIDRFERKYTSKMNELKEKYSSKQSAYFGRIKDDREVIEDISQHLNSNFFPSDINT